MAMRVTMARLWPTHAVYGRRQPRGGWQGLKGFSRGLASYRFETLFEENHLGLPRLPIPPLDATLDR